jgi:hypothetical protein
MLMYAAVTATGSPIAAGTLNHDFCDPPSRGRRTGSGQPSGALRQMQHEGAGMKQLNAG